MYKQKSEQISAENRRFLPKYGSFSGRWALFLLSVWLGACTNQAPSPAEFKTENLEPVPPGRQYQALGELHYHAPDFAADIRPEAPTEQAALNKARKALAEQHPTEAIALLRQVPAEYENDASYLQAHALFMLKNYPQSAVLFTKLAGDSYYGQAAQWYSLLAMMSHFERRKTYMMEGFKKIAGEAGNPFQGEARQMISEIVY